MCDLLQVEDFHPPLAGLTVAPWAHLTLSGHDFQLGVWYTTLPEPLLSYSSRLEVRAGCAGKAEPFVPSKGNQL